MQNQTAHWCTETKVEHYKDPQWWLVAWIIGCLLAIALISASSVYFPGCGGSL